MIPGYYPSLEPDDAAYSAAVSAVAELQANHRRLVADLAGILNGYGPYAKMVERARSRLAEETSWDTIPAEEPQP